MSSSSSSSSSSRSPSPLPPAFSAITSSVLADFFFKKVPQLTGTDDAYQWKTGMRQYALFSALTRVLDGTDVEPGRDPSEQRLERAGRNPPPSVAEGTSIHRDWLEWQKQELTAQSAIFHSLSPSLRHYLTPHLSARAQWDHLAERYSFATHLHHKQLVESLETLRLPEDASLSKMEAHWGEFESTVRTMRLDGSTYPLAYVIRLFLESLPQNEEWWLFNKRYERRVGQDQPWEDLEGCWRIEIKKKWKETAAEILRRARKMEFPEGSSAEEMKKHWKVFDDMFMNYTVLAEEKDDEGLWAYLFLRSLPLREYTNLIEEFDLLKKPARDGGHTWDALRTHWYRLIARVEGTGR
ncbi:hypothetical protein IAT38_000997 [Cryptococcus sp. DSM 104549]